MPRAIAAPQVTRLRSPPGEADDPGSAAGAIPGRLCETGPV